MKQQSEGPIGLQFPKDQESIINLLQQFAEEQLPEPSKLLSGILDKINHLKVRQKGYQPLNKETSPNQSSKQREIQSRKIQNQIGVLCDQGILEIESQLKNPKQGEALKIYLLTKKAELQQLKYEINKKQSTLDSIQQSYLFALSLIKNSKDQQISQLKNAISMKAVLAFSLFLSETKKDYKRADQLMKQVIIKKNLSLESQIKPLKAWHCLKMHYGNIKKLHIKTLLQNSSRNQVFSARFQQIIFDFSHEKITQQTLDQFKQLFQNAGLQEKVEGLYNGNHINFTQNRAVLHTALRAPLNSQLHHTGKPQMKQILHDVHKVLRKIQDFSKRIRSGQLVGATGKKLQNLIVIGIGGSYLSIQFVYEALRSHPDYKKTSAGRQLRFLANVDPIDFDRAVQGIDPERTLILINSKTFTTAQTMLNARSCKQWLLQRFSKLGLKNEKQIIGRHFCACSTNFKELQKFQINPNNVFIFWDFVGGRFSVWSSIGILPLSIHFGFDVMKKFLSGGHSIDRHLLKQRNLEKNIPLLLGLIGFYRTAIQGYTARAIIPYCQALCKFAPHIQQLDMQSNGKRVNSYGQVLDCETAVTNFGEPGTNGQHSFFQLLHQGRTIPVQFIGFTKSQQPSLVQGEVSNHDELMSNFFSQPDALAIGKSQQELIKEGVPEYLLAHKEFQGDRPSSSLLFLGELNAYKCGQLLALYEHRTSIEGFLWDINSYDQYGVQLGKVLAKNVRQVLRLDGKNIDKLITNSATKLLIKQYIRNK